MSSLSFDPLGRKTQIHQGETMLCKLGNDNVISYVNDYFLTFSEYAIEDIIGKTTLEIKHPEFPITVFNHIMQHVFLKKNIHVLAKDQTASGKSYWFWTDLYFKTDTKGELLSIYSYRKPAPEHISPNIIKLYSKLLKMEQYAGLKVAQNYFDGLLEEEGVSFEDYTTKLQAQLGSRISSKHEIDDFFQKNTQKKRTGLFGGLFGGK